MQSREFWCFSMHPSHLTISFSCFLYSLHSLLGQSFFIWGSILLGPSAKHMALKEPTKHQIFHQNPGWPWKKELGKIFHCIWRPCHAAWSSTLIVPGFPFAWRECIKGNDLEASRKKKGTIHNKLHRLCVWNGNPSWFIRFLCCTISMHTRGLEPESAWTRDRPSVFKQLRCCQHAMAVATKLPLKVTLMSAKGWPGTRGM